MNVARGPVLQGPVETLVSVVQWMRTLVTRHIGN